MKYLLAALFLTAVGVHPAATFAIVLVAWMAEGKGSDDGDEG